MNLQQPHTSASLVCTTATTVIYTFHLTNIKFKIIFNINILEDMRKNDRHTFSECNSLMLKFFFMHIFLKVIEVSVSFIVWIFFTYFTFLYSLLTLSPFFLQRYSNCCSFQICTISVRQCHKLKKKANFITTCKLNASTDTQWPWNLKSCFKRFYLNDMTQFLLPVTFHKFVICHWKVSSVTTNPDSPSSHLVTVSKCQCPALW